MILDAMTLFVTITVLMAARAVLCRSPRRESNQDR